MTIKENDQYVISKNVSCLDTYIATDVDNSYRRHVTDTQTSLKSVPKLPTVTSIDFRKANQFRKQHSPKTLKLPSYASCLRAQIQPKNFSPIKQYYQLLAKDEKLAKMNQKHFLKKIKDHKKRKFQQVETADAEETQSSWLELSNRSIDWDNHTD